MPKAKTKVAAKQKVLVRGADGALYVVSKDKPPIKLPKKEAAALKQILRKTEGQLSDSVHGKVPMVTSGVTLTLPEIFL
jgi:hypothetical protein